MTPPIALPTHALSVKQPWANLILFGGKDVENRRWPLPAKWAHRAVALHASKHPDRYVPNHVYHWTPMEFGAIVGVVIFDRSMPGTSLSRWAVPSQHNWPITRAEAIPIPGVPAKGALGFWRIPAEARQQRQEELWK